MHLIVTTFRGADIKVEVANFCAAMDTLIDQDATTTMTTTMRTTAVAVPAAVVVAWEGVKCFCNWSSLVTLHVSTTCTTTSNITTMCVARNKANINTMVI